MLEPSGKIGEDRKRYTDIEGMKNLAPMLTDQRPNNCYFIDSHGELRTGIHLERPLRKCDLTTSSCSSRLIEIPLEDTMLMASNSVVVITTLNLSIPY